MRRRFYFAALIAVLGGFAATAGLPPTTLKGQSDATRRTVFHFQAPNSQVTRVAGTTALIETGSGNRLADPGFEGIDTSAWTASGGTFTQTSTAADIGQGAKSGSWDSSSSGQTLTSTAIAITSEDGFSAVQGYVSCRFKCDSGTCTHKIQAHDGSSVLAETVISSITTGFARSAAAFTAPASGTIALRVESVAADEPVLFIDQCWLELTEGANFPGNTAISRIGNLGVRAAPNLTSRVLQVGGIARYMLSATEGGFIEGFTTSGTGHGVLSLGALSAIGSAADVALYTLTAAPIRFGINAAQVAMFDASGNLGINATPSAKLDVDGSTRLRGLTTAGPVLTDASGNLSSEAQLASSRGGTGVNNAGTLTYGSNNITLTTSGATSVTLPTSGTLATLAGSETLTNKTLSSATLSGNTTLPGSGRIDSSGNIGIGASPSFGTGGGLEIQRAGSPALRFDDTTNTTAVEIYANSSGLTFEMLNASRNFIFSSANVGIGTSSVTGLLTVRQDQNTATTFDLSNADSTASGAGGSIVNLRTNNGGSLDTTGQFIGRPSTYNSATYNEANATIVRGRLGDLNLVADSGSHSVSIWTGGTPNERVTVNSSGLVTIQGGGLSLGTSASSGTGVTSDSTTANYYEEITLTGTLSNFNASPPAITIKAIRVGKAVTIFNSATVSEASKTNTSDPAVSNVLPSAFRPVQNIGVPFYITNNATNQFGLMVIQTDGTISFRVASGSNAWTAAASAAITQGAAGYSVQ
jgi:hypothetical protein